MLLDLYGFSMHVVRNCNSVRISDTSNTAVYVAARYLGVIVDRKFRSGQGTQNLSVR